jgi:hypothetical protein
MANGENSTKTTLETLDRANMLSDQLSALLLMTFGEGGESFRSMSDVNQDNYMSACHDMAVELREIVHSLGTADVVRLAAE